MDDSPKDVLGRFHPVVGAWFRRVLGEPTAVQARAWDAIDQGKHTLIAAPTGSGKTLAAFLTILNNLIVRAWDGTLERKTTVLYISPLKALSNDVEKNLNRPLREIQDEIFQTHLRKVEIEVAVRTGDTPASERAAMLKANPHILITTPESLFLLLTAKRGRDMLRHVRTVIVDEIHALVGEKRGAHLALSLERLQALVAPHSDIPTGPEDSLVRIGLSATQRPIEEVARFLTGQGITQVTPVIEAADTEAAVTQVTPAVQGAAAAVPDPVYPACAIIDTGHRRVMDLQVEIPPSPLTAVMSGEVWEEVYARIEALIAAHKTTLVFVNTRRLAERVAHRLSQSLGEDKVAAHHGSLSKERRFAAEQRLKSGELSALVATASLELGIDIGSVDLVIQIACPKSISALLQRVGRSGHAVGGLPKGRIFPLTRDELIEAAALLDSVRRGELDTLTIPAKPLDILAQQIVAETACREWGGMELYHVFRRAYPFRDLDPVEYREIVSMLAQGFTTRRGRRGAHLHWDAINDRMRARPGARLTALTNGGAIPDTFDYDVKLEPGNVLLGSVNEDFAIDSSPGDIFQLGNNSWRILRMEGSTVRVADAAGESPTIPFWFGEAPGRSQAFSESLSRLRLEVAARLGVTAVLQERVDAEGSGPGARWKKPALDWLCGEVGVIEPTAEQIVDYLAAAQLSLGVMPSRETLVLERFFDEAGDMHMILHSPYGSRINRAWGLSLRKRFCRKFNFELQAAATEDGLILSLGATHSFPLDEVYQYLRSGSVRHILIQALLDAPMFEVRWRWNATRALALQRNRNGKRVPPQLQRMAAEDLVALVFPDQKACFENIQGEREVPDHPLVRQTINDCLHEAMDIDGLEALLTAVESGRLGLESRDLKEPSPLSQEIISARPYAFLDDAPLEERRTRAIRSRHLADPAQASDMGRLDPQAIAVVRAEAWPQVRNADELHDALLLTGYLTDSEIECGSAARGAAGFSGSHDPRQRETAPDFSLGWKPFLAALQAEHRVASLIPHPGAVPIWVAAERLSQALAALPKGAPAFLPGPPPNPAAGYIPDPRIWTQEEAVVEMVRGRMESMGPVRNRDVAETLGLPTGSVDQAFYALEQEGFILRGRFTPSGDGDQVEWCERRLLARIHRYTLARLRKEIEPVSASEYMRFLFAWQGLTPEGASTANGQYPSHAVIGLTPNHAGTGFVPSEIRNSGGLNPSGPDAVESVLSMLEGFEAPCAAWESEILPSRIRGYEPSWLDLQGLSGAFIWGRLRPGNQPQGIEGRKSSPMKSSPIAFLGTERLGLWLSNTGADGMPLSEPQGDAMRVLAHLRKRGASFWREILWETGLDASRARDAIAELASHGWITSDGFRGLRALLHPGRPDGTGLEKSGRWTLLRQADSRMDSPTPIEDSPVHPIHGMFRDLESLARVLLKRYGVVFRMLADRENLTPPWRDLVRTFRTLESRGEIRGGRFVEGFYGEQFALPEAVGLLRRKRKESSPGQTLALCAADPANLQGILTPGPRIPATRKNRILFLDGEPVAAVEGCEFRVLAGAANLHGTDFNTSEAEKRVHEWRRSLSAQFQLIGETPNPDTSLMAAAS